MAKQAMGFDDALDDIADDAAAKAAKATTPAPSTGTQRPVAKTKRRKTTRTVQMNLKVTPEFYDWLEAKAQERGEYMVEVLEALQSKYGNKL